MPSILRLRFNGVRNQSFELMPNCWQNIGSNSLKVIFSLIISFNLLIINLVLFELFFAFLSRYKFFQFVKIKKFIEFFYCIMFKNMLLCLKLTKRGGRDGC